jgi:hypothetical protein
VVVDVLVVLVVVVGVGEVGLVVVVGDTTMLGTVTSDARFDSLCTAHGLQKNALLPSAKEIVAPLLVVALHR